ncbi:MAG: xylulokinase [Planctomycetes bacterium]|nr:xylulokinase [Planctomycetota bacterium]
MTAYLLGIDVGTGGCKALLIDEQGNVVANVTTEYPLLTPKPLWSEQNPQDWYNETIKSICKAIEEAQIDPKQVAAIGLTGQMHGLVLLDKNNQVLRPAILWNDQRTAKQCDDIHKIVGLENVIRITGKPALTGFTAPKILWVRENEPEIFAQTARILLPKDYVRFRLSGEYFSDVADASGTSLFDVANRCWSYEIIDALNIKRSWLPVVTESPIASTKLSKEAARTTGIASGIPIVAGAGDQAAEAIGCGVIDDGEVSVTIGTSGVVFAATNNYRPDTQGKLHTYCHAIEGVWHAMGVMLSAGGSLRWYRDTLCKDEIARAASQNVDPYDLLIEEASHIPAGNEGLFFLPYLTGERTPHADPNARGAFIGLTLRHNKQHMTRALLEGVTFGLMDCLELVRALGTNITKVRVSGGGARSQLWRQIMADIFETEIATVNITQGAAYGAALLAGVGVGIFDNVRNVAHSLVKETSSAMPGPNASIYREYYQQYRLLYPALADQFNAIGSLPGC